MTRYIQRHSALKRWVHGIHTATTIGLIITGLFVFVPSLGQAVGKDILNVLRMTHRVFAVIFIVIPLGALLYAPKGLVHMLKNDLARWDEDDWTFMKRFLPYLFAPKKIHMPKQREVKSGQRLADGGLVVFAVLIAISGALLWAGKYVDPLVVRFALLLHDISFVGITFVGMAHAYLGAGIFQPYRGSARLMFGDGKVSEPDALYHWGHWAEEQLATGTNIVEE